MSSPFKDLEHIKRLLVLIVAAVAVFAAARFLFTPKDFGKYGHYRAGSVEENMGRPLIYAGKQACRDCHEDRAASFAKTKHQTVSCETCHGALMEHTQDPSVKPGKPAGRKFCLLCHGKNVSKPKMFPQVDPGSHNPGQNCIECHNPHNPRLE